MIDLVKLKEVCIKDAHKIGKFYSEDAGRTILIQYQDMIERFEQGTETLEDINLANELLSK